jgi:hypothetical protein
VPITIAEANEFVLNFHRHNKPVTQSVYWALGASDGQNLVGVGIVGRPVARLLCDGFTAEVRRVCVVDHAPKGTPSFLYALAWRIWAAMGGHKLVTYTLQSESGASMRGAGWRQVGARAGRTDSGWNNRPGRDWQPVVGQAKFRWEKP